MPEPVSEIGPEWITALREAGYRWDERKRVYSHDVLDRSIEAGRLPGFPGGIRGFKRDHRRQIAFAENEPGRYADWVAEKVLRRRIYRPGCAIFLIVLLLGWSVMPWRWWLGSLVLLFTFYAVVDAYFLLRERKKQRNRARHPEDNDADRATSDDVQKDHSDPVSNGPHVFSCPECGQHLSVSPTNLAKRYRCPNCGHTGSLE